MKTSRHNNRFSVIFFSALITIAFGIAGCGDTSTEDPSSNCGGHGVFHGDHCDCDPGYIQSADGLSCEPEELTSSDEPANQDQEVSEPNDLVFNPSNTQGSVGAAQDGSEVWIFEAMDGGTMLRMELYAGYGAPTSPGVVDITSVETNYATCGTCLMLRTGCVAHGDHYDCTGTFMPRAEGQVQVDAIGTAAGEQLTGQIRDIVFQQVSIGQDYTTTPVNGGDLHRIESWAFDVQLSALPSN